MLEQEKFAKCYMMKGVQTDISSYLRILTDSVSPTEMLIIDNMGSDQMFNTNV